MREYQTCRDSVFDGVVQLNHGLSNLADPLLLLRVRRGRHKESWIICVDTLSQLSITKVNYFDVYSSEDLIEVIVFKGMISVGEEYTFLSLNVKRHWGVSTNQRLS